MPWSLDDSSLAVLRRALRELGSQVGAGVSRRTLVEIATVGKGYRIEIYGGDPPLALASRRTSSLFAGLTAREHEVASLVAEGCANRDIAARLFIAEATVKDHVHNILRKTGLTSRAAIAGLWARYEASPFDQTTSVR
jgi:DNA-binding NarL/FixJ family response regulator